MALQPQNNVIQNSKLFMKDTNANGMAHLWPFATAMTLTGLANLLNDQEQNYISKDDFWTLLKIYTKSQHLTLDNGNIIPWIDENLDSFYGRLDIQNHVEKSPA